MYLASGAQSSSQFSHCTFIKSLSYAVPALLYGVNNNIIVYAQEHMDPASSQVLGNLKIVTTAVWYRLVIHKRLTWQQWLAVGLLGMAGMCYGGAQVRQSELIEHDVHKPYLTVTGILLMLVYCTISGAAGVYTEYILKRQSQTPLHLQNIQLYLYGVSLNMLAFYSSTWNSDHAAKKFFDGYSLWTVIIIISQAVIGLIMSVVMKHGSNIIRLFVISCAMIANAVLSMVVLALQPTANFWLAFVMVLFALHLYYQKQSCVSYLTKFFPV
ncbi:probable UDP-sugar transporter protein SLC35A4 isoform X2 [Acanthaster planci]|nr:probable UDP-sugar transporter protein SLC35A4 isoform X2 [Acanthaster planci]